MFSNLHCHSYYSLLDSIASPQEIVDFAVKHNQGAVCVSDHGTLSAMIETHKLARKAGVKCLTACEIYEVDNDQFKNNTKEFRETRYHLLLIAKNDVGKQNLINIVSYANVEGKYIKPRIDLDTIEVNDWGNGIICLTACAAGRLSKYLVSGKDNEAKKYVNRLYELFDDVYCEIQSHNTDEQTYANKLIYEFSQKYGYKYVITTDAHMINKEDRKYQSMFVEVGQDREVGETYIDCFMQTEEDVYDILLKQFSKDIIKKGVEATQEIVNMCDQVDVGLDNEPQMPTIDIPSEFKDNKEYLRNLCFKTFNEKFGHMSSEEQQKRRERIETELPVLYELDFTDYFIMLHMIANECRNRGISLGYSRGSGGNCLCLFMLNVTQIDSVRWNLDFSRFANLGRKGSMADYDFDVDKERRADMIQVMKDLFGYNNVCNISTFNTFTNKVAIRDIGKVLNDKPDSPYCGQIPIELRDSVAKIIPVIKTVDDNGEEIEVDIALSKSIKGNKELEDLYKKFPLWFDYAIKLSGLPKSRSMHASAIMVLPKNMKAYCSVCLGKDGDIMYESEMHALMDDINLIKMDCLGLKNISIVNRTLQFAGLTWQDVDINHLDLEDKEVYDKVYKVGETVGVFQMESAAAREMLIKAQADNIEDIIVVNSANRPATKDSFPTYCYNKLHPNNVEVIHKDLKDLFKQSCCILLYQEQALALLRYAGFPEIEVETARRAIGKKIPSVMSTLRPKFVQGLKDKGWTDGQSEDMWELLLKQSSYSFNRGHAVAYSLLSYLTAYLKIHYPVEFMTACLIAESDSDKVTMINNEVKRLGIEIAKPNINLSNNEFRPLKSENKILYGFDGINGLSKNGVDIIMANRPYASYQDFMERGAMDMGKGDVIALIKSGSFDSICHSDKIKMFKLFYSKRFDNKKEDLKPINKVNKTHIKWLYDNGYIDSEQCENKEYCTNLLNKTRKSQGWVDFQSKYCKGTELDWEMETLNAHLSGDPFDNIVIPDWDKVNNGEVGYIGGVVIDVKEVAIKNGKNKGQKMCFLNISYKDKIADIVVFNKEYVRFKDIFKAGMCLVCKVEKQGELNGVLKNVKTLNEYMEITADLQKKG